MSEERGKSVSIGEFEANVAEHLRRLAASDSPLVLTQDGERAAVVLSPAEFDRLNERLRLITKISRGLADSAAGRTTDHEAVRAEMEARFGPLPRPAATSEDLRTRP